ncbi:dimethyladenosine transferase 2, mitochondrial [Ochlerotatus camptorhynchus]|uniref:dimethyladenosine transferase 2, mitochondrial n=1 Tax=Ochlerotatus camptorhynchus TaxID=644619 RepID=UPI0031DC605F
MISRLSATRIPFKRNLRHETVRRTLASTSSATPKERKKKPPSSSSPSQDEPTKNVASARLARDLEEYFEPRQYRKIVDLFPPVLFKRSQTTERFYLASPERAKTISQYVTEGLSPETRLVEINPGPGLLTKELLRKTDNLLLYESDERFEPELNKLVIPNKKMELRFADFNGHWRQSYMDSMDQGSRLEKMLRDLPNHRRWRDEEVNFRLFSVVGSLRFFKTLINSVSIQKGLLGTGRCEMILAVPPLFYVHLTCSNDAGYKLYRCSSVLFQIFFEHEFIAKIPRRDFLPWPTNPSQRRNQTQYHRLGLVGSDELYLMRVVPRRDLFDFCLPDNLKLLTFFISQNMVSRKNRVIPALERWIPFCGARLILNQNYVTAPIPKNPSRKKKSKDSIIFHRSSLPLRENDFPERMTIFTEFGELTPSQILTVFNEFVSWPEFRQSPFLQTMEQHYSKQAYGRLDPLSAAVVPTAADDLTTAVAAGGDEDVIEDDVEPPLLGATDGTDRTVVTRGNRS